MSETRFNEKHFLRVLAGIHFSHIVDFMIIMPLGPAIMRDFDVGASSFGLLISAYTYSGAISALLIALLVDRFSRRKIFLLVFASFILSTMACACAQSYEQMLVARTMTGAFGGVLGALIHTLSGDFIPYERRGKASGLILSAFSIASILGVPVSLSLTEILGWRSPFILIGCVGLSLLIFAFRVIPSSTNNSPSEEITSRNRLSLQVKPDKPGGAIYAILEPLWVVFHLKSSAKAIGLSVSVLFASFLFIPYITLHLIETVKIEPSRIPLVYLLGGGATFVTSRLIGYLTDRYGKLETFRIVTLASIIPLAVLPNLGPSSLLTTLSVTTVFFIFVSGRMVPLSATLVSITQPEFRGRFMSINSALQQVAMGTAAWVGGTIIQSNYDGNTKISILAVSISLFAIIWSRLIRLYDTTQLNSK